MVLGPTDTKHNEYSDEVLHLLSEINQQLGEIRKILTTEHVVILTINENIRTIKFNTQ